MPRSYPVSRYCESVQKMIQSRIPDVWVHGVLTQVQIRGRMVYLALAEYQEGDAKPVSVLALYCFINDFNLLNNKASSAQSSFLLEPELKVSLQVRADFYVPSGKFQARVLDLDLNYTLGELARTKQDILQRLKAEGLLQKNASVPMPRAPLRIGLITAQGSAAENDFCKTLLRLPFALEVVPVYARMQGNETEASVLVALESIRQKQCDVVCIIRGGGSRTDLNYFDSEVLCRAVANFPLPVLTGIGHEIDTSLTDEVAWKSFLTPTNCADFIVQWLASEYGLLLRRVQNLQVLWQKKITDASRNLEVTGNGVLLRTRSGVQHARHHLEQASIRLRSTSSVFTFEQRKLQSYKVLLCKKPLRDLHAEHERLKRNGNGLRLGPAKLLEPLRLLLPTWFKRMRLSSANCMVQAHKDLAHRKQLLKAGDPRELLRKGYVIPLQDQNGIKKVANFAGIQQGDPLTLWFAEGKVESLVQKKEASSGTAKEHEVPRSSD
jgi:exodeoxyribonuclease VII large subunit